MSVFRALGELEGHMTWEAWTEGLGTDGALWGELTTQ